MASRADDEWPGRSRDPAASETSRGQTQRGAWGALLSTWEGLWEARPLPLPGPLPGPLRPARSPSGLTSSRHGAGGAGRGRSGASRGSRSDGSAPVTGPSRFQGRSVHPHFGGGVLAWHVWWGTCRGLLGKCRLPCHVLQSPLPQWTGWPDGAEDNGAVPFQTVRLVSLSMEVSPLTPHPSPGPDTQTALSPPHPACPSGTSVDSPCPCDTSLIRPYFSRRISAPSSG